MPQSYLQLHAHAGAVDLGEAVDVVELHAELAGDALAHLLAPALAADEALGEGELVADALLGDALGKQKGVARGGAQHRGLQVDHHAQLLFGVARAHGDGHGAKALGAELEADARGPQAVAGRDVDAVELGAADRLVAAGEHLGPVVDVLLGVGDDDGCAGGAARGVDAHDLLVRHRLDAQRVRLAQIGLLGEGKALEALLVGDLGDVDVGELPRVERAALLDGGELLQDRVELERLHLHGGPFLSRLVCVCCA